MDIQIQLRHHFHTPQLSSPLITTNPKTFTQLPKSTLKVHAKKIQTCLVLQDEIPSNARRRKKDPLWRGGFSLGVDLGLSRTGIALFGEFIIGLPKSSDGKETPQSNKVRSVAGRLAVRAAQRGWRIYLQDEHGTSVDAMHRMINMGVNKSGRHEQIDAYAAKMILERYFSVFGEGTELVWPKQVELQDTIRHGPLQEDDDDDDSFFDR